MPLIGRLFIKAAFLIVAKARSFSSLANNHRGDSGSLVNQYNHAISGTLQARDKYRKLRNTRTKPAVNARGENLWTLTVLTRQHEVTQRPAQATRNAFESALLHSSRLHHC